MGLWVPRITEEQVSVCVRCWSWGWYMLPLQRSHCKAFPASRRVRYRREMLCCAGLRHVGAGGTAGRYVVQMTETSRAEGGTSQDCCSLPKWPTPPSVLIFSPGNGNRDYGGGCLHLDVSTLEVPYLLAPSPLPALSLMCCLTPGFGAVPCTRTLCPSSPCLPGGQDGEPLKKGGAMSLVLVRQSLETGLRK